MFQREALLKLLLIVCLDLVTWSNGVNYKTTVGLQSSWTETPILAEVSEYLASDNVDRFWDFVDRLSGHPKRTDLTSTNQRLVALELLDQFADSASEVQLAQLLIGSRSYSPAVQMNNHEGHQCRNTTEGCVPPCPESKVWAIVNKDKLACSHSELKTLLQTESPSADKERLYEVDKVRSSGNSATERVQVVLYGDLREEEVYTWHKTLSTCATDSCLYVFRHFFRDCEASSKTALQGYGVELVLKSTEYKAMDDSKDKVQQEEHQILEENAVLDGFNFTKLMELHPDLRDPLLKLHQDASAASGELKPLKQWQMRQLGLQAAFTILHGPTIGPLAESLTNKLEILRDISQNFPSRTNALVNVKLAKGFTETVKVAQGMLLNDAGIRPGSTHFYVNGMEVPLSTDIFALMEFLRHESKLIESFRNLGFTGVMATDTELEKLLHLPWLAVIRPRDVEAYRESSDSDVKMSCDNFVQQRANTNVLTTKESDIENLVRIVLLLLVLRTHTRERIIWVLEKKASWVNSIFSVLINGCQENAEREKILTDYYDLADLLIECKDFDSALELAENSSIIVEESVNTSRCDCCFPNLKANRIYLLIAKILLVWALLSVLIKQRKQLT
ncbi:UDP-glucose:glycoprotein glucosyltransferase 2 [Cichlidogyrus casuarinus]|uniref:UDP-glucose:glycoprotein glucosyltransferase 2 n=1 Tax=Cichlidogyrus casuarinus TaxID=1844966 RepID=A0ABD2PXH3_9PLAT